MSKVRIYNRWNCRSLVTIPTAMRATEKMTRMKPKKMKMKTIMTKMKMTTNLLKLGTHWGLVTQYTYCNTKQVLCSKYCHNTCIVIHVIVS